MRKCSFCGEQRVDFNRGLLSGIARSAGPLSEDGVASAAISKILVDNDLFLDYCPSAIAAAKPRKRQSVCSRLYLKELSVDRTPGLPLRN
jgi:hypothetical protein